MAEDTDRIPLAALIDAVREEMLVASRTGSGKELQLEVEEVNIEVEIAVTAGKKGEAGLKVWVLTAGGSVSREDVSTQRVSLKLSARDQTGNRFNVKDLQAKSIPRD